MNPGAGARRVTGAVLFTDLVGFTAYTEAAGDDAAVRVLDVQSALAGEVVADHDGARIVKELGDGLLLWFGDPDAGLSGALAIQASVENARCEGTLPLAVRMGLHCGEVSVRGDDLVGLTVNTAARIVALAGPGELLVSDDIAGACRDGAGRTTLEAVGPIRVKGLRDPIWLHRVAAQRAGAAAGAGWLLKETTGPPPNQDGETT